MNYIDAFNRAVRTDRTKTALVSREGDSYTYGELDERTTRLANGVNDRLGDARLATMALNGVPTVEAMVATCKRGIANAQLPFRSSLGELTSMIETADAEGLLFDDPNADKALDLIERLDIDVGIHAGERDIDHPAVESYENVLANADTAAPVTDDAYEYGVLYTSGTTSAPKGVLFDQEQMWYGATQTIMEMSIQAFDTAIVMSPWYHMVTTDAWILPHLQAGATLVIQPEFEPPESLALIEEHDVTGILAVPTQLHALVDAQQEGGYDLGEISYIRTGGSIVTEQLVERASEHLSENVFNTYGLTEGGPNLTFAYPEAQQDRAGTIGKDSYMWTLRVVETTAPDVAPDPEATVAPGETGEILASGPGQSYGYLDNPEASEKLTVDGWLRTGDVAEIDDEGYLYIVDRVDNMIISGGENVYPQEVETVLEQHENVAEAAVFGLPDDHWGECVASVVTVSGAVDRDDLDAFLKESDQLADFKRPREYVLTEESLPRTDTGTLQHDALREEYFDRDES